MNNVVNEVETGLDIEWVALILEAKELGLSIEEVHTFLQTSNKKE